MMTCREFRETLFESVRVEAPARLHLGFLDLNGDAYADIVSGPFWYANPGGDLSGTWAQHQLPAGSGGEVLDGLFAANIDRDKDQDLIAMAGTDGKVFWLEHDADSGWQVSEIGNVGTSDHGISSQGYRLADLTHTGGQELIINIDPCYAFSRDQHTGSWTRRETTISMLVLGAWCPRSTRHQACRPRASATTKLVPQSALTVE